MSRVQVLLIAAVSAIAFNEVLSYMDVTIGYSEIHVKNDKKHVNFDNLRLRKVKKAHLLNGNLEFIQDIGNDYTLAVMLYKSAGNDYKLLPYKIGPKPFCQVIAEDTFFYAEFKAASDLPEPGVVRFFFLFRFLNKNFVYYFKCPWPKVSSSNKYF